MTRRADSVHGDRVVSSTSDGASVGHHKLHFLTQRWRPCFRGVSELRNRRTFCSTSCRSTMMLSCKWKAIMWLRLSGEEEDSCRHSDISVCSLSRTGWRASENRSGPRGSPCCTPHTLCRRKSPTHSSGCVSGP